MNIPLVDLKMQYYTIQNEIKLAIDSVLERGRYVLGPETERLEATLSKYTGTTYAIACSSGTDALLLALLAIDLQPGDEVISTPLSFFASSEAVSFLKGKPVFVDIDPETYCMDPAQIEAAITPKTKAILPVHIFGQCAEMDPILEIAKKHNLYVIEDACQAIGATYKNKKSCSMGDLGVISFYPSKNLGGYGDGGMVFTHNEDLFKAARDFRTHGEYPKQFKHKRIGTNSRISEIEASILNVKQKHIDAWNQKRRDLAQNYDRLFSENNLRSHIQIPKTGSNNQHTYHLYLIQTAPKESLQKYLAERGISTGNHFPKPIHHLDCYEGQYAHQSFPIAEGFCEKSVSLPMFPELTFEQQETVVRNIKVFFEKR